MHLLSLYPHNIASILYHSLVWCVYNCLMYWYAWLEVTTRPWQSCIYKGTEFKHSGE